MEQLEALLKASQDIAGIMETWCNAHQGEPIANLLGSFVRNQMALNEALVERVQKVYPDEEPECFDCGRLAHHRLGGRWYCHAHLGDR